ncbi:50S ribosomal protein L3 N(5)-glutamine methyltransferase [Advenella sp. WQ 585]|uniref:Ribosomal protein uL3 glutamine methyltransferase n=1 Tax=Advenella mandrilli TaxID=2800330 RepID=A0ABS1ED94_9BURK|nr:50S ribosomal protein L3 N(5)-glutamine methyltransferase [Advenella mandrilli]MBK1780614.1 50S ribosomal protein L3 N(5)-glutamine methyltransferase [Advenella mandrilli]
MTKIHNELKTVRDMIRFAVSRFNQAKLSFGHGSDSAWDEAVYLVLHTLNLPLDTLEPFLDARLLEEEKKLCLKLIDQRVKKRIPLAYLIGEAWLQGHKFIADKRVIVPRSPISELLSEQLNPWVVDPENTANILDMCTGSGCLAILAALAFPQATIDAVDISDYAIRLANVNVAMYGLEHQVNVIHSDLFEALGNKQYDFIICNPPYVNSTSMKALPVEYQNEPELALDGGEDGMELIRRILKLSPSHLQDDGFIVLEIGHEYENFMNAFPTLDPVFLETETTSHCILLLNRTQLLTLE